MKIIQLIQKSQLRGAEMFASQLGNHLMQQGNEVILVSLFTGNAKLPFTGQVICLKASLKRRFIDVSSWSRLNSIIRKFNPDIIQANAGDTLKFAISSKVLFRWKTPVIFRNANLVSDFINSRPKLWFNKFFVSRLDHVISVSEVCRRDFIRTYKISQSKATMVSIGIELTTGNTVLPSELDHIFSSSRVIMNVASMVKEKNQKALLPIVAELKLRFPDIHLLIVGDGKLKPSLEAMIQSLGLENHVSLLGYRTDVLSILPRAAVFVLPSLIEGLPAVILESFASKVPVVAYVVGGIGEVLSSDTGWPIEKNNVDAFKSALIDILNSVDEMPSKIANASDLVSTHYSNALISRKFTDVYKSLVG